MRSKLQSEFPHLKSVDRISRIPVFESGYNFATSFYNRIKHSNRLFKWSLNSAEFGVLVALEISLPAVSLFETPINAVDKLFCKSLDIVEGRVPAINYPPKVMYTKTKDYVSAKVVQPVMRRAGSVKQISMQNASKYSEMAASKIDSALNVADKYVDKYLPDTTDGASDETAIVPKGESKTIQTFHHASQFSRKLQRRLTRRTIAEARALKQQSADTLHCLIYLADLLARDPKAFMEKAKAMWAQLSEDEPENQVPPANLEQLIAMFTREVARKFVHVVNYTGSTVAQLPHKVGSAATTTVDTANNVIDYLLKKVYLHKLKVAAVAKVKQQISKAGQFLINTQRLTVSILERIFSRIYSGGNRLQARLPLKRITGTPAAQNSTPANNQAPVAAPASNPQQPNNASNTEPAQQKQKSGQNQNNSKKNKEQKQQHSENKEELQTTESTSNEGSK